MAGGWFGSVNVIADDLRACLGFADSVGYAGRIQLDERNKHTEREPDWEEERTPTLRHYDAAFKKAAVAYCARHDGDRSGTAAGLCARPRRRFVPKTTDRRHDGPIASNRLAQRAAPPTRPDEAWGVGMTYIGTAESRLFLAVVLDLHSRKVVGWAFVESLHASLPLAPLRMAPGPRTPPFASVLRRCPAGKGSALWRSRSARFSDRGCQYASAEYRGLLLARGLEASISRTGNPYDNAWVESSFPTLKTECRHRQASATRRETQAIAFDYIEPFYNGTRLHSALGYQSPVDFENINTSLQCPPYPTLSAKPRQAHLVAVVASQGTAVTHPYSQAAT